jgi:hypothetical protein
MDKSPLTHPPATPPSNKPPRRKYNAAGHARQRTMVGIDTALYAELVRMAIESRESIVVFTEALIRAELKRRAKRAAAK